MSFRIAWVCSCERSLLADFSKCIRSIFISLVAPNVADMRMPSGEAHVQTRR